jgi:hypothetical protein
MMDYERPMIARRERIEALLDVVTSDSPDVAQSDVNLKENIAPVAWPTDYGAPAVASRTRVTGLLVIVKSDSDAL